MPLKEKDRSKLIAHADAGKRMQIFLDDPVIQAFLDNRRRDLMSEMLNAKIEDDATRRNAALSIRALDDLKTFLTNAVTNGNRARAALDNAKEDANG